MRECGLKSLPLSNSFNAASVTPRAGVWIEICNWKGIRGRKGVTPRAGVWIEIRELLMIANITTVTPRAGVWIEI